MSAAGHAVASWAASFPEDWLDGSCRAWLSGAAGGRGPVVAACSGGADSVFLVLVLAAWSRAGGPAVEVAHFHHGQRGAEADGDAASVRALAEELGLVFHAGRAEAGLAGKEAALREARYGYLHGICEAVGALGLALGQHAGDLLEGQLLALVRGSGLDGLSSPRPVRRFPDGVARLRPLLGWSRGAIERELGRWGIDFREDSSNADPRHRRNGLRARVVPELTELVGEERLRRGILRSRERLADGLAVVDAVLDRIGLDVEERFTVDLGGVRAWPREVGRRALRRWWNRHWSAVDLERAAVEAVLDAVHGGEGRLVAAGGPRLLRVERAGRIFLEQKAEPVPGKSFLEQKAEPVPNGLGVSAVHWNWASGPLYWPDGYELRGRLLAWAEGERPFLEAEPWREVFLAYDGAVLRVRGWRSGDRYRPLGSPGRRKLQDLFTDRKIPVELRRRLPVIEGERGDILWVPGFGPAHARRLDGGAKWALQLTYQLPLAGFPQTNGHPT